MQGNKAAAKEQPLSFRLAAKGFAENNLPVLARDLLSWRKTGKPIPVGSCFHDLAVICAGYVQPGDEYQEAERLIGMKALEAAAAKVLDSNSEEQDHI